MPTDEREIATALESAAAYRDAVAERVEQVEHRETHISHLFFVGSRVFKLKKHVRLDFLDYGTLDRRRHFCEEEVRLNRRLVPDVYLGAVPVAEGGGDGGLRVEGEGPPVAWAVKMVRLPADRMLERLLEEDGLKESEIEALVEVLARFHGDAATGPGVDEHGAPPSVAAKVGENLAQAEDLVPGIVSPLLHRSLVEASESFLDAERDLLTRRVREGRIREGHGDLHASNICFAPAGPRGVAIYDCIEFSRRLRCGDVASDVAFLAMDLDRRGHARTSDLLVRGYAERSADEGLLRLVDFYKGYRAVVRAKVSALSGEAGDDRREADSAGYFQLAASYALSPALLLTCGLPATGKSRLARELSGRLGAVVLRSDVVRKELAGIDPTEPKGGEPGEGIYDEEMTRRTYDALLERALDHSRAGRTVIVDASFGSRARRASFRERAAAEGRPLQWLHVTAAEPTVRERLERRARDDGEPSDADHRIYEHARKSFQPPEEVDSALTVASETDSPARTASRLLERRLGRRADS